MQHIISLLSGNVCQKIHDVTINDAIKLLSKQNVPIMEGISVDLMYAGLFQLTLMRSQQPGVACCGIDVPDSYFIPTTLAF